MRIIVFDRVVDELNRISTGLRADGFDVVTVSGVAEGLQLARHYCPDAAVIDVSLSGKKIDPIQAMVEMFPDSPVIAICGLEVDASAADSLRRGADQILFRPVELLQLSTTIRQAVERFQLRNQLQVVTRVQQDQQERHDQTDRDLADRIHTSNVLLEGLNDVAHDLTAVRDEAELLRRIPAILTGAMRYASATLLFVKDGEISPESIHSDGSVAWLDRVLQEWQSHHGGGLLPVIGDAYESNRSVLVRNTITIQHWPDSVKRDLRDYAVMATPIRSKNLPVGVIVATMRRDKRAIDDSDIARLEMCATLIGMSIDSVRTYDALEQKVIERTDSLRRQRVRAQALMDSSASVVLLVDPEGRIVVANGKSADFFGVSSTEVLEQSFGSFLKRITHCFENSDKLKAVVSALREKPDTSLPEEYDPAIALERQMRLVAPKDRWISIFAIPVQAAEGEDLGTVWVFADISREKSFHEQIRILVEASPIPAIISRVQDGRILYANRHLAELVGIPTAELIGRNTPDFYYDPDDRKEVIRRLAEDGYVRDAEFRIKAADGSVVWMIFSIVTAELDSEQVIIGNLFDITARRLVEDELRRERNFVSSVLDTAAALVVVLDPDGRMVRFNRACEKLTGYSFEEVRGKAVWDMFLAPEDTESVVSAFAQLASGEYPITLESHWLTRTGEKRLINWSATSIVNDRNEVEYVIGIGIDFTDRRQAEEDLRLYREIFVNTNDAIAILDPQAHLVEVNPAYLRLSGFSLADTDRLSPVNILKGDGFQRVFDKVEKTGAFRGELKATRKDGTEVDIDLSAFAIHDNRGNISHRVGFSRDITERKKQEKALAVRLLYEEGLATCSAYFLTEREMNSAIQKVLQELLKTTDSDRVYVFENFTDDQGRLSMRQTHEAVRDGISTQIGNPELQHIVYGEHFLGWQIGMQRREVIRHHTDELSGPEREIMEAQDIKSILVLPIYLGDDWTGFIGFDSCRTRREWTDYDVRVLRTISEMLGVYLQQKRFESALKISEERFRSLVENANDVIYSTNQAGEFTYISPKFTDILGYDAADFVGTSPQRIMHPEDVDETNRRVAAAINTGSRQSGMEFRLRHKDGSWRWFESNFSIVGDERSGELIGIAHDITEIKTVLTELSEAYRDLRDTQAKLLQSEKMASLGSLVAGIAHEINTPIGAVASMHNTLVRAVSRLHEQLREFIASDSPAVEKLRSTLQVIEDANRVIENGTERVTTIVRRLRSFARLDEAVVKTVDIHEGIEDTLTLIHHEIKNHIDVVRDYGKLPPVSCFPGQLNQVFLNILVNARQAIGKKGSITIATRSENDKVLISFSDTGIGMAPATIKRIFDPGFTTKGVGVGTGLGLSICYQIIEGHHGEIHVDSAPGKGTTFSITLPIDLETILEREALEKKRRSEKNDKG